jgi:hypothetical protein
MKEKKRARVAPTGPNPGGLFDDGGPFAAPDPGMATVGHGPYLEQLPVAGETVGHARERFRDRLDIHPEARAVIDGRFVPEDTTIHAGQIVTFVRPAGAKGA